MKKISMKALLLKDLRDGWGQHGTVDGYIIHKSGSVVEAEMWHKSTGGCYPENQDIYSVGGFLVVKEDLELL